jgi:hypothetical protein
MGKFMTDQKQKLTIIFDKDSNIVQNQSYSDLNNLDQQRSDDFSLIHHSLYQLIKQLK